MIDLILNILCVAYIIFVSIWYLKKNKALNNNKSEKYINKLDNIYKIVFIVYILLFLILFIMLKLNF